MNPLIYNFMSINSIGPYFYVAVRRHSLKFNQMYLLFFLFFLTPSNIASNYKVIRVRALPCLLIPNETQVMANSNIADQFRSVHLCVCRRFI